VEYDERAEQLKREADKMEQESERVEGRINDARSDWESKQADQMVPGAQADPLAKEDRPDDDEQDDEQDDDDPEESD
jgi:hypothetical protein